MSDAPSVAVVDIGSNSIKALVAERGEGGRLRARMERTLEARISAGISADRPMLGNEGIERGVAAVRELLAAAAPLGPTLTVVVATSAVRDARNGAEFCGRVRAATGQGVRVLAGEEEARLIGRGLLCDPELARLQDFRVFDLGGGSLEVLAFAGRRLVLGRSLPLGCVRLAERFAGGPGGRLGDGARAAIGAHVAQSLRGAGLLALPSGVSVGTGGTLATVRRVLAPGNALEGTPPLVPVAAISALLGRLGALPLEERRAVPGLPPERADVFPAGLAVLEAVAGALGIAAFHHSLYNLRWGLAAEALGAG